MAKSEIAQENLQIKKVERLPDWSILFPYSHKQSIWYIDHAFKITKEKDQVYIQNITEITNKNKGYIKNKDKTIPLDTSSQSAFLISLGAALNEYIGEQRPSALDKGKDAYRLLGYAEKQATEAEKKAVEKKLAEETQEQLKMLKNTHELDWNEKRKELSFIYKFGTFRGQSANITYTQLENKKTQVEIIANNMFLTHWSGRIIKEFSTEELGTIPDFIINEFNKGIPLIFRGKVVWELKKSWEEYANTIRNMEEKAKAALTVYRQHLSQK